MKAKLIIGTVLTLMLVLGMSGVVMAADAGNFDPGQCNPGNISPLAPVALAPVVHAPVVLAPVVGETIMASGSDEGNVMPHPSFLKPNTYRPGIMKKHVHESPGPTSEKIPALPMAGVLSHLAELRA